MSRTVAAFYLVTSQFMSNYPNTSKIRIANSKVIAAELKNDVHLGKGSADPAGSIHLLTASVGPLSAGNDFNWWNLVIVHPGGVVSLSRLGCYAVYACHGNGSVDYLPGALKKDAPPTPVHTFKISASDGDGVVRQSNVPGFFTLEIRNTDGLVPLVVFVCLAIDPGTTPVRSGGSGGNPGG